MKHVQGTGVSGQAGGALVARAPEACVRCGSPGQDGLALSTAAFIAPVKASRPWAAAIGDVIDELISSRIL